jgi:KUP system potassium uptake protein
MNPAHAVRFFGENGVAGFLVLGAVFLVATGGEALYADLGHFGIRPIRLGWFGLAGFGLLLNYFGQGALLLGDASAAENPFYRLAPEWARIPLLLLATAAAVIASQAIISGSFSLTRQAVQLGYLPRLEIVHTSAHEIGQIYVPFVNAALMVTTIGLVVGFRSSSAVASAYGIALTTTMFITTLLAYVVARRLWGWPRWLAGSITVALLVPDLSFFGAAIVKIPDGGWFPLAMAAGVLAMMTAWQRGRSVLSRSLGQRLLPVEKIVGEIGQGRLRRVAGTAVYLTGDPEGTPIALLHNIKLHRIVHERNVFLTVLTEDVPYVEEERRLEHADLGSGFHRLVARFGFMEDANVPALVDRARAAGVELDVSDLTYVLSRVEVIPAPKATFARWRRRLFIWLSRNALAAERFFRLPPNRTLEIWMQAEV